jgi:hypothetical protein
MSRSRAIFAVVALNLAAPPAQAQRLIRRHIGSTMGVAGLSDFDGDSVRDYARLDFTTGLPELEIYSGASGSHLFDVSDGQSTSQLFGNVLSGAGDLDGDGVPDFLVGAFDYVDPNQTYVLPGAVIACSGKDGHLIQTIYGSGDYELLGYAVAGIDDVDGDGTPDFLAGAVQGYYPTIVGNGYVRCFSGRTGAVLYQVDGASFGDGFGSVIAALSDHDGDGLRDFAVRAGSETRICSGATGATIASIPPTPAMVNYSGLAEVDDIDGDGEPEIALSEMDPTNWDGQVRVVSIPTQTQLRFHTGGERMAYFGTAIATISDADGDGVRDYLISAPGWFTPRGSASLHSGRTGERLYRFVDPDADSFMAWSIADAGDLDHDGRAELLIASPYHEVRSKVTGAALIYAGNDLWLNAEPKLPVAGATESLEIHGAPSGNPVALFLTDVSGTPTFTLVAFGTADAAESFTASGIVPPGLTGMTMRLHAYALDASSKLMSSANETIYFQ